jgi:hypothetical protein
VRPIALALQIALISTFHFQKLIQVASMKNVLSLAASVFALVSALPANARQVCNHDPVCQAKRDGTTVEQAKKLDRDSAARPRSSQGLSYERNNRANCKMKGTC